MCFSRTEFALFSLQAAGHEKHSYFQLYYYSKQLWWFPLRCCCCTGMVLFSQKSSLAHHHHLPRGGRGCLLSAQPPVSSVGLLKMEEQEDSRTPCSQPASPGMNFPSALCTRHRKITQQCSTWEKDLENNMPWFQPDHPGVQETNPSHIIAPESKTPWSWFHQKVQSHSNIGTSWKLVNGDKNHFIKN